jgi:uncharacterized DUF497 family protein
MTFEWDERKARTNLEKHGIDFADAATVLNDDFAIVIPDDHPSEERFVALGVDLMRRLLVVVFAPRGESIRIISARKANRRESKDYGRKL